jgi:hypothetical protein
VGGCLSLGPESGPRGAGHFCGLALRNYWLRNSTSCGEAGRVEAAHICSFIAKPRESS